MFIKIVLYGLLIVKTGKLQLFILLLLLLVAFYLLKPFLCTVMFCLYILLLIGTD